MRSLALFAFVMPLLALPFAVVGAAQETPATPATPAISWRSDYAGARAEALSAHGKPLLVVFRCLNRPEEVGFDTRDGRPVDPELVTLVGERYIPVRLSSIKGVNLADFRFDYDLQFVALVVRPTDGAILARWGTRDADSPTARLSLAGLKRVLRAAADAYEVAPPSTSKPSAPRYLEADPGFARTRRAAEPCYHCHYAYDAELARERTTAADMRHRLFRYPLPESIGITLDTEENDRALAVRPKSPAAKAGVRAGDRLRRIGETSAYSSADMQFALDGVREHNDTSLLLVLEREGKSLPVRVGLPRGWYETEDISWRASQGGVPPFLGTWETPLSAEEKKALKIPADRLALKITLLFKGEKWAPTYTGLEMGDMIVGAEGKAPPAMNARQFHTWFRLHYTVGATARLNILRDGKPVTVSLLCRDVDWQ